jgi:BirA family biotin operon repressor/biotin-[acetyl-CoA-carboxylase] ligase
MHTDAVTTHALDLDMIRQHLRTTVVGRHLYLHETVSSTNAVLRELAERGATEGTVVLAEHQTAGRGRAAKPWFSPSGLNLYASVLLRPAIPVGAAPVFAFVASLALADAIREAGVPAAIKWPNDVLVGGRKVAGVRAEMATAGERLEDVILGVGVNLNVTRAALLAALGTAGQAATSLSEHLGTGIDRNLFAARFLNALEEWTVTYRTQGARAVLRAWGELDITVGRRVEVREDSTRFDGRALGVDADGHLQVEDSSGHVHAVVSGEVRLLE